MEGDHCHTVVTSGVLEVGQTCIMYSAALKWTERILNLLESEIHHLGVSWILSILSQWASGSNS